MHGINLWISYIMNCYLKLYAQREFPSMMKILCTNQNSKCISIWTILYWSRFCFIFTRWCELKSSISFRKKGNAWLLQQIPERNYECRFSFSLWISEKNHSIGFYDNFFFQDYWKMIGLSTLFWSFQSYRFIYVKLL